jgi:hypothetical protein
MVFFYLTDFKVYISCLCLFDFLFVLDHVADFTKQLFGEVITPLTLLCVYIHSSRDCR